MYWKQGVPPGFAIRVLKSVSPALLALAEGVTVVTDLVNVPAVVSQL